VPLKAFPFSLKVVKTTVRRGWHAVARDYFFRQVTRVVSLIAWLLGDVLFAVPNLCSVILTADCVNNEYEAT
jgi:hypothetical protein